MRNPFAYDRQATRRSLDRQARRGARLGLVVMLALVSGLHAAAGHAASPSSTPQAPGRGTPPATSGVAAGPGALQIDPAVVVEITSPRPGQRLTGRVNVTGYAADRRSPSGSGLNERDIQLYVNDSADPWNLLDYAVGSQDSPAAAAALGPSFGQVGFRNTWETCTFPEGSYRLLIWVSSLVTPGARNFASVDVYIEACPPGTPITQNDFESEPGGVYALRVTGPETRRHIFDPIYGDFAAGIDARCTSAAVDCSYGLQFRELPGPGGSRTNSYYRFTVDPTDGTFTLGYSPPGDDPIVPVVPWSGSPTIVQGTATNRLAVIVQGAWLRLFINGQQVGEARDERRPWGQLGFTASTTEPGQVVEVTFDNLLVSTPGPAEVLPPIFPGPGVGVPAAPGVLLRDDFSNPASGWPRESSNPARWRVGYANGEYQVAQVPGTEGSPFVTRPERFGDFLVELDARLLAPTENAYLYLDFRRQDTGSHYSFIVDPNDSTFLLRRNDGQDGATLIPWTTTPAIQRGTARNRLGVRARGADITLFVNGQEVGRAQDGALREGALAFGVGSFADGIADARFDNLVVSSVN